jgi:hypothetical protein
MWGLFRQPILGKYGMRRMLGKEPLETEKCRRKIIDTQTEVG